MLVAMLADLAEEGLVAVVDNLATSSSRPYILWLWMIEVHDQSLHYGILHLGALLNDRNQVPSEVKMSKDDFIGTNQKVDFQKLEKKVNIEICKCWIQTF